MRTADFKTVLVDWVDDQRAMTAEHPDPETLARLRRGELPAAEAQSVREHLLGCRECLALWRDPEAFAPQGPRSDFELAAFWRTLEPRLEKTPAPVTEPAPLAKILPFPQRSAFFAVAASLAAGVVGLALWGAGLQAKLGELSRPVANAPIIDLAERPTRSGTGDELVTLPAGTGFTLVLTPAEVPVFASYELRIVAAGERVVSTLRGLAPHAEDATFSLWLPAGALPAGELRLELVGVEDGQETPLGEYRVRSGS